MVDTDRENTRDSKQLMWNLGQDYRHYYEHPSKR